MSCVGPWDLWESCSSVYRPKHCTVPTKQRLLRPTAGRDQRTCQADRGQRPAYSSGRPRAEITLLVGPTSGRDQRTFRADLGQRSPYSSGRLQAEITVLLRPTADRDHRTRRGDIGQRSPYLSGRHRAEITILVGPTSGRDHRTPPAVSYTHLTLPTKLSV